MQKQYPIIFSNEMVSAIIAGRKSVTRRIVKPQPDENGVSFMKNPPCLDWEQYYNEEWKPWHWETEQGESISKFSLFDVGDIRYVRETYYQMGHWEEVPGVKTKGGRMKWKFVPSNDEICFEENKPVNYRKGRNHKDPNTPAWHKRLARFMPKKYARTYLKVTNVCIERLQDITEEQAINEGIKFTDFGMYVKGSVSLDCGKTFHKLKPQQRNGWHWQENVPNHEYCLGSARSAFINLWESIHGIESWNNNDWVWVISFEVLSTTGKPNNLCPEK